MRVKSAGRRFGLDLVAQPLTPVELLERRAGVVLAVADVSDEDQRAPVLVVGEGVKTEAVRELFGRNGFTVGIV